MGDADRFRVEVYFRDGQNTNIITNRNSAHGLKAMWLEAQTHRVSIYSDTGANFLWDLNLVQEIIIIPEDGR